MKVIVASSELDEEMYRYVLCLHVALLVCLPALSLLHLGGYCPHSREKKPKTAQYLCDSPEG